jgi:hypothetical protein
LHFANICLTTALATAASRTDHDHGCRFWGRFGFCHWLTSICSNHGKFEGLLNKAKLPADFPGALGIFGSDHQQGWR